MKKTLLAVLLALTVIFFTACGTTEPTETTTSSETTAVTAASGEETTVPSSDTTTVTMTEATTTETTRETTRATTEKTTEATTESTEPPAPVETPVTVLERICSEREEIILTYYTLEEPSGVNVVVSSEEFLSRCSRFLYACEWEEEPVTSPEYIAPELYYITISGWGMTNDFITFSSVLGSSYAQALDFTDVGVVLYDSSEVMPDGTVVRRWLCSDDLAETSFIEMLREVFFDLEYAKTEFSVFGSYDPVMVCESFVRKDYFNARNSLTSGNHYRFKDYSLISYSITEVNADNTAFVAGFRYAFVPENWEHPYVWAGNTEIGTGEFEGMLIESRSFAMKLGEDVTWYCTDIGTGRASLPE